MAAANDYIASREAYRDEMAHIDLSGPHEASMGESVCPITFMDSTSR